MELNSAMTTPQYRIIVSGKTLDGWDTDHAIGELAKLFNGDMAKAKQLLSGKPSKLNKALDKESALRYRQKLMQAGVACVIEELGAAPQAPKPAQPSPVSPQPQTEPRGVKLELVPTGKEEEKEQNALPDTQMRCPKCGEVQDKAPECRHCHVVIDKFNANPSSIELTIQENNSASVEEELEDLLKTFVGVNTDYYMPKFRHFMMSDTKLNFSVNWVTFFFAAPWLFHRKMYWQMLVVLALPLIIMNFSFMASSIVQLLLVLGMVLYGNSLYYLHAVSMIEKLDDKDAIARRGGTHAMPVTILFAIVCSIAIGALSSVVFLNSNEAKSIAAIYDQQDDMSKPGVQMLVTLKAQVLLLKLASQTKEKPLAYPDDESELAAMLGLRNTKDLQDEWGTPIVYERQDHGFKLSSAGPDQKFGTADDAIVVHQDKP